MKRRKKFSPAILTIILFIFLNNSSFFGKERSGDPLLFTHRAWDKRFLWRR